MFRSSATSIGYHDHSVVFIVARAVYLLLALKMVRRNVCFLNYQMLKERGNSRDKYMEHKIANDPKKDFLGRTKSSNYVYIFQKCNLTCQFVFKI